MDGRVTADLVDLFLSDFLRVDSKEDILPDSPYSTLSVCSMASMNVQLTLEQGGLLRHK